MSAATVIRYSLDGDGVGWIVFDDPASRVNVFTPAAQDELDAAIGQAIASNARAVVVSSAKERIFIAGADMKWLASLPDAATAAEFSRRGQQLFQRLNELPVPVVCAIHGACAGGGFELALACHWRIASNAPATQIGLPETGIGTMPGWGGCVRLPRLIGIKPALEHILKAQLVSAADALRAGFINECVAPAELPARAKAAALELVAGGVPPPLPAATASADYLATTRASVEARTRGRQPALLMAIDAVEQASSLPIAEALEIEAQLFGQVSAGEICKNMIYGFGLRDAARKRTLAGWFEGAQTPPASSGNREGGKRAPIRKVGVVGAGVMGSGIAQWLASRGLDVVLRDVQTGALERGLAVTQGLFDDAVKRGRMTAENAAASRRRITSTTGWEGFETCDLVIEAIVESTVAKRALFAELATVVRDDTLLASNTSALPIEQIAGGVVNPARTLGIHFFNPVSRMPLVELILAPQTSTDTAGRALALIKALGKAPVICRSSPGFLVTRVLFFYLNEAVRLWEEGVRAAAVDGALREFGWPMGPLRLIDEVGVDVTGFIFAEMGQYFPGRFVRTTACGRMMAAGLKGRKSGSDGGFYRYTPTEAPNEVETRRVVGPRPEVSLSGSEITGRLMRIMADEAGRCLADGVVKSPEDIDFALLMGAGFPAFRGGLMHWARTTSNPRSGVIT